jgi:beta-alanine degradation protein BauB
MNHEPPDTLRRALLGMMPLLAIMESANAQDAAKVQAQSYRIAFENDRLRVLDYNSRPTMGVCGSGMHSHPAHLTVLLSAGKVRIRTPDGKVDHVELPLGTVFWSEAETHEVENVGGSNLRSLIIELKTSRA